MNLTSLNPYMLYIKIAAVVLVVIGLFFTGVWVRGVFAERDALRQSEALAKKTTEMYAEAWNKNAQMQKEIVDAVKNIRVSSNNYIAALDSAPAPVVADGGTVVLVAPGVPQGLPAPVKLENYSAGRIAPPAAGS